MTTKTKRIAACGCIVSHDKDNVERLELCKLHAAAPEMYEALKELVNATPLVKLNVKNSDHYSWMVRMAAASKALAKADGKN